MRLTGSVAVAHDELGSVSRGTGAAGVAALVLVVLILLFGMRSARLVAASIYTLLFGLLATAAFAAFAVGTLNLITVAFAVLYIGLGIDYAIHLSLRYRELVEAGEDHAGAMRGAARDVGSSLVMCALTTVAGFYAFVPTAYSGVSELGVISGTGMIISLIVNLTVLPAALSLAPVKRKGAGAGGLGLGSFSPARHRKTVWAVTAVAFAASVVLLTGVRFNYDPMELRDPETESVATYYDLMKTDNPPLSAVVLEDSLDRAEETARGLDALSVVDRAMTVADFVPEDQDEKLGIIWEMGFLLGPDLIYTEGGAEATGPDASRTPAEVMDTLEGLEDALGVFVDEGPEGQKNAAGRMFGSVKRFIDSTERLAPGERAERIEALEESITWALGPLLEEMAASLEAGPVTLDDLPGDLKSRWVSPGGLYRVESTPAVDVTTDEGLKRFVGEVRAIAPSATGAPVFFVEASETVIGAFVRAFAYALVLIAVILLVITGSAVRTVLVLTPMLLAGLFTAAGTVLLGVEFNFANTIALPLILGIGVDNGIHMVRRVALLNSEKGGGGGGLLSTSTARGVLLSALTTTVSFGGLAFSSHPGTASIGWLLALGVVLTLVTTLVVLPALVRGGAKDGVG